MPFVLTILRFAIVFCLTTLLVSHSFAETNRKTVYVHTDLLGSPVVNTDENGNVIGKPPEEPAWITVADQFSWSVKADWAASPSDNLAHYNVQYMTDMQTQYWSPSRKLSADQTSFSITHNNLFPTIKIRVQACSSSEACSEYVESDWFYIESEPEPPASVTANIYSEGDVTIAWSASANTDYYLREVSINSGGWANTKQYPASQTSVVFYDQQPRTYQYRIAACNDVGCSDYTYSSSITVAYTQPPPEPSYVSAEIHNGDDILISWGASSGAVYYNREVSINGGSWISQKRYERWQTSVWFLNQKKRSYRYRVRACHTECSDWRTSNSVTVN